jgi:integrase/recombinase XerC
MRFIAPAIQLFFVPDTCSLQRKTKPRSFFENKMLTNFHKEIRIPMCPAQDKPHAVTSKKDRREMLLSEAIEAYGLALSDSPQSRTTQRNYFYHTRAFAHWLTDHLHRQPRVDDVTSVHIRAYLTAKERIVSPGTLYQYDAMLRHFCAFLVKPGKGEKPYLLSDPTERIARPKNVRGKRVIPSKEVIAALPGAPDKIYDPYRRLLARAVLSVMMDCALRPGEVRHLLLADYDRGAKTLTIRAAKGNKGRVVYLPTKTVEALNEFLRARPEGCRSPGLFAVDKGRSLGIDGLPKLIGELLYLAGHRKEEAGSVTPHAMRHVAAKKLLNSRANMKEIMEILGHASLNATQAYLETTPEELRDALERATQPSRDTPPSQQRPVSWF